MPHFLSQDTCCERCVIKDILHLIFEDLNQSMSPLKITYHYISSVTVSSSNTHPVCASCLLTRQVLLGHLVIWRRDQLDIPKRNGIIILCCVQSQKIASLKTCSILVPFRQENAKWWNIQGVSRIVDITAGDFLGFFKKKKKTYKHVSNSGWLRSYDHLKLRIEGNDYWQ